MKVATIAEKINNPVIGYVFFSAMFTNFNTYKYDLYVYENLRLKIGYTSYNMKTIHQIIGIIGQFVVPNRRAKGGVDLNM